MPSWKFWKRNPLQPVVSVEQQQQNGESTINENDIPAELKKKIISDYILNRQSEFIKLVTNYLDTQNTTQTLYFQHPFFLLQLITAIIGPYIIYYDKILPLAITSRIMMRNILNYGINQSIVNIDQVMEKIDQIYYYLNKNLETKNTIPFQTTIDLTISSVGGRNSKKEPNKTKKSKKTRTPLSKK